MPRRNSLQVLLALFLSFLVWAPGASHAQDSDSVLLDSTFRIDIKTIDVTFDYFPDQMFVDGVAHVTFVMRPGQTIPRFHFSSLQRQPPNVSQIVLDGQVVPFPGASVITVNVAGSSQPIIEINRPLAAGSTHTLDVAYRLTMPSAYPRFSTPVNDEKGQGNEELFPTLNTPHELARHRLTLRVHSGKAMYCIGSGLVQAVRADDPHVQQWVLDTEREVASYTVMFAMMPVADTDLQERIIQGIPVRILAPRQWAALGDAFTRLETWLPKLVSAFGPYPAPRGLSVFLLPSGGGMEYFGGTITTYSAMPHEVTHNYFACAVVMRTYRDTWIDEAIAQWFTDVYFSGGTKVAISESYTGNWVGNRSPVSVTYSNLAYTDGARILQYMADRLGGNDRLVGFLRYVYERYAFTPFTTQDFVLFFRDYSGIDLRTQFERWLFNGAAQRWERSVTTPLGRRFERGLEPSSEPAAEGR